MRISFLPSGNGAERPRLPVTPWFSDLTAEASKLNRLRRVDAKARKPGEARMVPSPFSRSSPDSKIPPLL
jgi:hypothetical protein